MTKAATNLLEVAQAKRKHDSVKYPEMRKNKNNQKPQGTEITKSHDLILMTVSGGKTLLVGEGNMSFSRSLIEDHMIKCSNIISTILERYNNASERAQRNSQILNNSRADVRFGVDARKIDRHFSGEKFDTVIFQFPNTGSRESKYGHNEDYVMLRRFLRAAKTVLNKNGKVLVTVVDSSYYDGRFRCEDAAHFADLEIEICAPFDPRMYPLYHHENTNDENSSIAGYNKFKTWSFRKKK